MPPWLNDVFQNSSFFMPHGHCYLWIPSLLWLHVVSDTLIGIAYIGISVALYLLVRKIRLPFSPVFIAFGLFIALCGLTHFMGVWTVWNPDYLADGLLKAATAAASVATAIGLLYIKPQIEEVAHAARLSEERRIELETKNVELEELYKQIKNVNELKTQFFSNISHELRTPLALILGPTENLMADSNLTAHQKRQLQSIERNGKVLLRQVNDLLEVARLEEGQIQLRYSRLDVIPIFCNIASQFEIAAEDRNIDYEIATPEYLVAEVDSGMLERILVNLLSNAFKFTPENGRIRFSVENAHEDVVFSVTDSGPGISEADRDIIFERFRQTDGSATRSHGGSGLGLAIVKEFVQLHGGDIEVTPAESGGAKFNVRLPTHAPETARVEDKSVVTSQDTQVALEGALYDLESATANNQPETTEIVGDRPSILVVEDTPDMSYLIAETLARDYNVLTAADGKQGLTMALAQRPDLIATDIMMPRMSGDQLVAELRSRSEFDLVPIILLTAKKDDELRVKLLENGAQDYLTKPFSAQELRARVNNLISMKLAGDALRDELASVSGDVESLAKDIAIKHRQLQVALDATEVAREQAERASQIKSHFLAMISHEMRTPLSTIHMNSQLLARHNQNVSDTFRLQLGRVERASQQLTTLIEGLLQYTRFEAGKIVAKMELVNVTEIAQEAIDIGHSQIISPGVELVFAPVPENAKSFVTDPRLLRVILNNLITNALKFTEEGTVVLRLWRTTDWRIFEVEDSGIGISDDDIHRIFKPFERLEPIKRKSIPGVGLGLALTKELVETLGGKLEVQSRTDVGSVFRVLLPEVRDGAMSDQQPKELN